MSEQDHTEVLQGVVLRSYAPGDLDAMFRLDEVCFEKPFRFLKSAMRRFAEARKAQVLLAVHDEELAAFSIVHLDRSPSETVGYVLTLDVAPEFRRQGLAQCLLARAEQDAKHAGCRAMLLHVFTSNVGAVALYEKFGYARIGVAENFYSEGLHAWVYRKALM